jgi:hypothetical protein
MDWRDYSKQPHIQKLIESKGIEIARQHYVRESNKAMWDDPFVINEHSSPGQTVSNNNSAPGSSNASITGNTAEVSQFTWAAGITNSITGSNHPNSASLNGYYIDITGWNGTVDYSYGHTNSMKTFRCYVTSASNFAPTVPDYISGVITASYNNVETVNITGSIISRWKEALVKQSATATVAGFTNTIAPSTLFTPTIAVGSGSLTITNVNAAGVRDISTNFSSATASVSVTTQGLDKYYNSTGYYTGAVTFDGSQLPYTSLTRR